MNFEFATAGRIVFGMGTVKDVGRMAASMGRRALLVTGAATERTAPLLASLTPHGIQAIRFAVPHEPSIETVERGVALARMEGCDMVIGFGGGSPLDAGKAIAAMLSNPGEVLDYLEIIGKGRALSQAPLPFIAIPTTAGTGAEVTRNAVLSSPIHRMKVSLRSPLMLPRLVVVDPELTLSVPPAVTAATGLDALTQVIEPFLSNAANPITDGFCREGMARTARSLRKAFADGSDAAAREDMAMTSLLGGLALANAKLGAVHGFAGTLGGMFEAPHGAVCAALLPHAMSVNVKALLTRDPSNPVLARHDEVARILTGKAGATAVDGVAWIRELCADLRVPGLAAYGLRSDHFETVIAKAAGASSMKGNPILLNAKEMAEILSRAL
ncbi:iron-containing alcohol dehydrogenase [Telmatospirillum siberiense]|uniref:Alcohol dehydrogenase n=1 Tax=Telmatospirillum siberiense TaxID=382514 RepID=A0A2N3PXL0_9PROT|nr:iron-containing alcohol dehydrogenase [Telmatospirillum siberiense]PKU25128.1 alcohol dehydrogenase [Telmatospirillum siberiense]